MTRPLALPAPRPWWRGRTGLIVAVALGMVIAFFGWRNQALWPASLTWSSLAHHLDNFQSWLSDHRNVAHPSVFFRAFNGFANFLDHIVGWLTSFFFKLTWVGTTALGVLVTLRFGGRRARVPFFLPPGACPRRPPGWRQARHASCNLPR